MLALIQDTRGARSWPAGVQKRAGLEGSQEACVVARAWEALGEKHAEQPPTSPSGGRGKPAEPRTEAVIDLQRRWIIKDPGGDSASCRATLQRRGGGGWSVNKIRPAPEM